jgi:hypothetical protein
MNMRHRAEPLYNTFYNLVLQYEAISQAYLEAYSGAWEAVQLTSEAVQSRERERLQSQRAQAGDGARGGAGRGQREKVC